MTGELWNRLSAEAALKELHDDVATMLHAADMTGAVSVRVIGSDRLPSFNYRAGVRFPMASLYKLVVMAAFCQAVDDGLIDPAAPVELVPETRVPGPTGLSICLDPVCMSWRDLVRLMMTISDNTAGNAVLCAVGRDRVAHTLRRLGLLQTDIRPYLPATDLHTAEVGRDADNLDPYLLPDPREYDPLLVSSTTTSDLVDLLSFIWEDHAATPSQCSFMRHVLGQQAWGHRFAEVFTYPGVQIAAKTGSLAALSHEAGVISHPDEPPIAVAVLTQSARRERTIPLSNTVVGQIARHCVRSYRQFL
ncbi:serine hydrolase [Kocuria marina]|uniref:serine hydrolase n=1 Tax=Kocuria marina TaxID=223184 RepID=UPI0021A75280|nr:serine hydrolase [Kocuria marina]MCT1617470.1 class A beta-lactamase-related serine hydrolase [Kocuria marina]